MIKRILILLIAMFIGLSQAKAWGALEHTVIAYVAQDYLTENAARNLRYYLDQPIYEYSEWMDYKPVAASFRVYQSLPLSEHSTTQSTG